MKFRAYKDVKEFYKDTYDILLKDEAQNLIPLGNIIIGNKGEDKYGWRDPDNWFMATVSDEKSILLTAIMTPPFNLTLYATDNIICEGILKFFVEEIIKADIHITGITSEKSLAEKFTKIYTASKAVNYTIRFSQRIYELTEVNTDIAEIGQLRLANEKDMAFFPYWLEGLVSESFGSHTDIKSDIETYLYHIMSDRLYVLEVNEIPVSITKITREMENVCGIGLVYTPPYYRGYGYATSCVAKVSSIVLERGFKKCVLYTDLSNPISNSIYKKIGYKPICDSLDIKFE